MPELTEAEVTLTDETVAPRGHACGACGAPVETLDRFCNACGTPQEEAGQIVEAELVQRHFRCKTCAAEVAIDADQRSYTCAFCDSTYVVEFSPEETDRQPPEFVIGFSMSLDEAQEKFRQWLSAGNWFRPGDLIAAKVVEKLRGVYLPFWSFSMLAEKQLVGQYRRVLVSHRNLYHHRKRQDRHQDSSGARNRMVAALGPAPSLLQWVFGLGQPGPRTGGCRAHQAILSFSDETLPALFSSWLA